MRMAVIGLLAFSLGCGDTTPPPEPISVTFTNRLYVIVRLSVAGQDFGTVDDQKTVVFPGGTTEITWTPENGHYTDGSEEVDDFGPQTMLVANLASLEFTNEQNGTIYVTPYISNETGVAIDIGITTGGTTHCIGSQPVGTDVQWGYYRIAGDTEIRFYRSGAGGCIGNYRYWDSTAIVNNAFSKSGLVLLTADVAP